MTADELADFKGDYNWRSTFEVAFNGCSGSADDDGPVSHVADVLRLD